MKIKLLALLSLLCFTTQYSFADTYWTISGVVYWLKNDGTAEVRRVEKEWGGDVELKSTFVYLGRSYKLKSIGDNAFEDCKYVNSVTIPNTVTSIGRLAFWKCGLTSISIPNSVKTIDESAFSKSGLTSIVLPFPLKTISASVFQDCKNLESVTISENVTTIENDAFQGCRELKSIDIPKSVTSIDSRAFDTSYLENVNVAADNKKYTSVDGVLYNKNKTAILLYPGARDATSFSIPGSVTHIGDDAFVDSDLTEVVIPNSVTNIGRAAFELSDLTEVNIPNSVKSIDYGAFERCKGLSTVSIPSSVVRLGANAFSYCENMKTVYIYNTENVLLDPDPYYEKYCPFKGVSEECVLYVPECMREKYEASVYNDCFAIILGMSEEETGIENVGNSDEKSKEKVYFDLRGNKLKSLQRGINIVRYSDGTVKKVSVM